MELVLICALGLIGIAGIAEITPLFSMQSAKPVKSNSRLLTPLEMVGRQIYIREGCFTCHSQHQDRGAQRYESYSLREEESPANRPFQWGSQRSGPDIADVGGKYSDDWQVAHLIDPRAIVIGSTMPGYGHLATAPLDVSFVQKNLETRRAVGAAYSDEQIANAGQDLITQADPESDQAQVSALKRRYGALTAARYFDGNPAEISEMDALVAYLQMLGTSVDTDPGVSSNER